jgi:hypothetical protein
MQDEELRELERQAASGDREAFWKLAAELVRLGRHERLAELHNASEETILFELERSEDLRRRGFWTLERLQKRKEIELWSLVSRIALPLHVVIPHEIEHVELAQAVIQDAASPRYSSNWNVFYAPTEAVVYGQVHHWTCLAKLDDGFCGETRFLFIAGFAAWTAAQTPAVADPSIRRETTTAFLGLENVRWRNFFTVLYGGASQGTDVAVLADRLCLEYTDCLTALGNDVLLATQLQIRDALLSSNLLPEPISGYALEFAPALMEPISAVWLGELLVMIRNRRSLPWHPVRFGLDQPPPLEPLQCNFCAERFATTERDLFDEHCARMHHVSPDGSPIP